MALNLTDSGEIMAAYDTVLKNELNWFLLHYSGNTVDELALYAFGSEGLEELKTRIDPSDTQQVLIGFLRVDSDDLSLDHDAGEGEREDDGGRSPGDTKAKYLLVSYVPKGVTGVRRARARVHTRRLGMIFKKHDAVLSVDDISQLTNTALSNSLAEPDPSLLTFSTSPLTPGAASGVGQVSPSSSVSPQVLETTAGSVVYPSPSPTQTTAIVPTSPPSQEQGQGIPSPEEQQARRQRLFIGLSIPEGIGRSYTQPLPLPPPPDGQTPFSAGTPPTMNSMNYIDLKAVKRSVSESMPGLAHEYRHHSTPNSAPGNSGGGGLRLGSQISNLLRRKKRPGSAAAAMGSGGTMTGGGKGYGSGGGGRSESESGGGKGGGMGDLDESQESGEDSLAPPTPPKDKGIYTPPATATLTPLRRKESEPDGEDHEVHVHPGTGYPNHTPAHVADLIEPELNTLPPGLHPITELSSFRHSHNLSQFAVVSHETVVPTSSGIGRGTAGDEEGDIVVIRPEEFGLYGIREERQQQPARGIETYKKGKWAEPRGLSAVRDPAERARMRMEMQRQKEEEEKELLRAEEKRQERIKRQKEEFLRMEEEEAERRKAKIQAEALRLAAERRRREEMEKEEEERKAREREERKRVERNKRMEEHMRLEEWRREQQRLAAENARMEEEAKRREREEWKQKVREAEGEVKAKAKEGGMTGWVTIQTDESVAWRRRYFKFVKNTFYFYRSPKDLTQVVDQLDVRGTVKALKEPKDGYEDLKAIPHSFAIEFHNRGPWAMFADSEEEKFKLLGLLQ